MTIDTDGLRWERRPVRFRILRSPAPTSWSTRWADVDRIEVSGESIAGHDRSLTVMLLSGDDFAFLWVDWIAASGALLEVGAAKEPGLLHRYRITVRPPVAPPRALARGGGSGILRGPPQRGWLRADAAGLRWDPYDADDPRAADGWSIRWTEVSSVRVEVQDIPLLRDLTVIPVDGRRHRLRLRDVTWPDAGLLLADAGCTGTGGTEIMPPAA